MPYDLKGRNVLITGGSKGLGAVISEKFAAHGSNVAVNFSNDGDAAEKLVARLGKEFGVKCISIKADAGVVADCERAVEETIKAFGGIDIVIGNAGWTRFSKFGDLHDLTEEEWDKCWAVNVKGMMALVRAAMPTFNKNAEGGVFIITSSVAGVSAGGSSMAYSVTKAAGLRLMKNIAATQGPKLRCNAVLPGLLLSEWGMKFGTEVIENMKQAAILKDTTDLEDCANAYVAIAQNASMTGMKIQVDAGLRPDTA